MPTPPKNGTNFKLEIVRTLIDLGEPVVFKAVKTKNKTLDKKNTERQLVYYHLGQLVKDGIVIAEKLCDGETYYRCQPVFYTPGVFEMVENNIKLLHLMTKTKGCCSDDVAWKCLDLLIEASKTP